MGLAASMEAKEQSTFLVNTRCKILNLKLRPLLFPYRCHSSSRSLYFLFHTTVTVSCIYDPINYFKHQEYRKQQEYHYTHEKNLPDSRMRKLKCEFTIRPYILIGNPHLSQKCTGVSSFSPNKFICKTQLNRLL